jgi:hypothetical protein
MHSQHRRQPMRLNSCASRQALSARSLVHANAYLCPFGPLSPVVFPFHTRGELRSDAELLFYSENYVLCHLGDSKFEHGFGWNPDLLLRLGMQMSVDFAKLC